MNNHPRTHQKQQHHSPHSNGYHGTTQSILLHTTNLLHLPNYIPIHKQHKNKMTIRNQTNYSPSPINHRFLPTPPPNPHTINSGDRKSTRLNSSHANISYAVFCLKKKKISKHSQS